MLRDGHRRGTVWVGAALATTAVVVGPAALADYRNGGLPISCGGPGFSIAALDRPAGVEKRSAGASLALRHFVRGFNRSHENDRRRYPRGDWRLVSHNRVQAQFAQGDPGRRFAWVHIVRRRGEWRLRAARRDCHPSTLRKGALGTEWRPRWRSPAPGPASTRLRLQVFAGGCDPPNARELLQAPGIRYGSRAVTVSLFGRPQRPVPSRTPNGTPIACPDVAYLVPVTVRLREPLGDRVIRDGGIYPPTEIDPADWPTP